MGVVHIQISRLSCALRQLRGLPMAHQWAQHEPDLRGLQDVEGTDTHLPAVQEFNASKHRSRHVENNQEALQPE